MAISNYTQVTDESELLCGGYLIQGNSFTNTFSCPVYGGGVLTFECIAEDAVIEKNDNSWEG